MTPQKATLDGMRFVIQILSASLTSVSSFSVCCAVTLGIYLGARATVPFSEQCKICDLTVRLHTKRSA
jgi:hypothetical protein